MKETEVNPDADKHEKQPSFRDREFPKDQQKEVGEKTIPNKREPTKDDLELRKQALERLRKKDDGV